MTAPTDPRLPGGGTPHPNPPRLCDPCRAEFARWYDYRPPRPVQFANHADYDETGRGIADNGQARFEQWRDTVRYQQDLIRKQCAEQHQQASPTRLVIDAFAGPGGWDTGLRMAGYDGYVLGIEHDMAACRTAVAAGHPRVRADVATFPLNHLAGKVEGLIASPPCQAWSAAGDRKGELDRPAVFARIAAFAAGRAPADVEWNDERSSLTAEPMRYAVALRPRWIALEQVPAVLPLWQYTAELLRKQGYRTWTGILSAEEYGVPQTRKRAILVASLDGSVGPPAPTHQPYRAGRAAVDQPDLFGDPLPPPVSMAQALGWDGAGHVVSNYGTGGDAGDRGERRFTEPAATVTGKVDRNRVVVTTGNNSRVARGETVDYQREPTLTGNVSRWQVQYERQANGGRRLDESAPSLTITASIDNGNLRWAPDAVMAQARNSGPGAERDPRPVDAPSYTIRANGSGSHPSGTEWVLNRPATTVCADARLGAPGHRDREGGERQFGEGSVRVTVQEAGVLQSFPADYPWSGTKSEQYRQCGDAVPPLLAAAVLRPLLAHLSAAAAA